VSCSCVPTSTMLPSDTYATSILAATRNWFMKRLKWGSAMVVYLDHQPVSAVWLSNDETTTQPPQPTHIAMPKYMTNMLVATSIGASPASSLPTAAISLAAVPIIDSRPLTLAVRAALLPSDLCMRGQTLANNHTETLHALVEHQRSSEPKRDEGNKNNHADYHEQDTMNGRARKGVSIEPAASHCPISANVP